MSGLLLIWSASTATPSGRRFTLFDDAMISMTYARTLARGGGLVWFEGAPRVEGITNPLWTLFMAFLHAIGLEGSSAALAVSLTGLTLVLVTALAAGHIARLIRPGNPTVELATVLIVPLLFPLMFWAARGMEVGLICACTFVAVALAIRMRRTDGGSPTVDDDVRRRAVRIASIGTCLAVGLMTRPDFAIVAAVIVAWLALSATSRQQRFDALVFLGIGCAVVIAAMTLDRVMYYGEVVPNTYTLKATGVPLAQRLARGVTTDARLLPALLIGAFALSQLWRVTSGTRRGALVLVTAVATANVAYSTFVGGDAWESIPNRYVAPTLAAVAIIVAAAFGAPTEMSERTRRLVLVAIAATMPFFMAVLAFGLGLTEGSTGRIGLVLGALVPALLVFVAVAVPRHPSLRADPPLRLVLVGCALLMTTSATGWFIWSTQEYALNRRHDQKAIDHGLTLRRVTTPDAVIAHYYAGAPAYYADRNALDILGKMDKRIANSTPRSALFPGHDKWDYALMIEEDRPDVFAGLWKPSEADLELLRNAGYEERCVAGDWIRPWVLVESPHVRHSSPLFVTCPERS